MNASPLVIRFNVLRLLSSKIITKQILDVQLFVLVGDRIWGLPYYFKAQQREIYKCIVYSL